MPLVGRTELFVLTWAHSHMLVFVLGIFEAINGH
jgi:hypothetical protein